MRDLLLPLLILTMSGCTSSANNGSVDNYQDKDSLQKAVMLLLKSET